MKTLHIIIFTVLLLLTSCTKKGCKDPKALNYNSKSDIESDPSVCILVDYPKDGEELTKVIVEGTISSSSNVVWSKVPGAEVDYRIEGDITIIGALTIEKGVVIEIESDAGIYITGKLKAEGTVSEKIVFKPVTSSWGGIRIELQGFSKLKFNYVEMIGGNNSSSSINCDNYGYSGIVQINNSIITAPQSQLGCGIKFYDSFQYNNSSAIYNTTFNNVTQDFCF